MRKAGDKVRINAQLIDATTGGHLWAERYDGQMDDIFSLQDNITQKIVAALAVKLTTGEEENIASKGTENIEAYDAFLKGWEHLHRITPNDFEKALSFLRKAIELDPSFSRAHAALAFLYFLSSNATFPAEWRLKMDLNFESARLKARKHLEIALRNPTSVA